MYTERNELSMIIASLSHRARAGGIPVRYTYYYISLTPPSRVSQWALVIL